MYFMCLYTVYFHSFACQHCYLMLLWNTIITKHWKAKSAFSVFSVLQDSSEASIVIPGHLCCGCFAMASILIQEWIQRAWAELQIGTKLVLSLLMQLPEHQELQTLLGWCTFNQSILWRNLVFGFGRICMQELETQISYPGIQSPMS